jgi:hypothetical protein
VHGTLAFPISAVMWVSFICIVFSCRFVSSASSPYVCGPDLTGGASDSST